jgi:hypothetical protein
MMVVRDVADKLHVHEETVRRWIRTGRLLAEKSSRDFVIAPENLESFLTANPKYDTAMRNPNNKDTARLLRRLHYIDVRLLKLEDEVSMLREEYASLYRELEDTLLEEV